MELLERHGAGDLYRMISVCPFCKIPFVEMHGFRPGMVDSRDEARCHEVAVRAVSLADRLADALSQHLIGVHLHAINDTRQATMDRFERFSRDDNDAPEHREKREQYFSVVGLDTSSIVLDEPLPEGPESPGADPPRTHQLYERRTDDVEHVRVVGICPFCREVIAQGHLFAAGAIDSRDFGKCQEVALRVMHLPDHLADALKTHLVHVHLEAKHDSRRPTLAAIESTSMDAELRSDEATDDEESRSVNSYVQMLTLKHDE